MVQEEEDEEEEGDVHERREGDPDPADRHPPPEHAHSSPRCSAVANSIL